MSGHSKWSTIKHKKAILDAKRGKAFTKLIKEISVAARIGGGDPAGNPRLRLLMDKAKEINMPLENAQRAIKKGTGELPGQSYEEFSYEGYGPNGIAVIVDTLTDNKNRMVAELRHLFTSRGGSIGESGSVSWMFDKMGVVKAEVKQATEDEILEKLLDFDISDIQLDDGLLSVYCDPKSIEKVRNVLASCGFKIESAQLEWVPKTMMALPDEKATAAYDFLSALDDHDDVQNVYSNIG